MKFEKQLFISYAHIDDQALTEGQKGWITRFHAALQALLETRLGDKAVIWRDERLRGNMDFAKEIVAQFPKTALLVSVVTPRYVKSEWCTREAREFTELTRGARTVEGSSSHRVFKVIKTPVDDESSLPAEMREQLGYRFYKLLDDQTPLELDPGLGDEMRQAFVQKLAQLAWDIAKLLKQLEAEQADAAGVGEKPAAPVVYLAECSYDRQEQREALEGELRRRGCRVLPEATLPRDERSYIDGVTALLARCQLSIHLIGTSYGAVPDGPTDKSVTILQNELAANQAERAPLKRIISLPAELVVKQPHQQAFIDELQKSAQLQRGADVLLGGAEAVKAAVSAALNSIEAERAKPTVAEAAATPGVYVLCAEKDRRETVPLIKFLRAQGYDPKLPVFSGEAAAVRAAHEQCLKECEALLLYYGQGDEAWRYAQQGEIKKSAALRPRPLSVVYTYLAAPTSEDKELMIELEEPNLIDARDGFAEAKLASFLQALNGATKRAT